MDIPRYSPSRIVCKATQLPPLGSPAPEATHCATCGHPIERSESQVPLQDAIRVKSFTDWTELTDGMDQVCGWCAAVLNAKVTAWDPVKDNVKTGDFTQCYVNTLITPKGMYPFRSNMERAWFLLNPPEPPYVVAVSIQIRQHLVWMAPVNYSRAFMVILLGRQRLIIRKDSLKAGREAYLLLADALNAHLGKKSKRKSPFASGMHRELKSDHYAELDRRLYDIDEEPVRQAIHTINHLTPGEIWGLGVLAGLRGEPTHPDAFKIQAA